MTLVDTPVVQELRDRYCILCVYGVVIFVCLLHRFEHSSDGRPPTPSQLVTLRVKSENGDEVSGAPSHMY